jgi:hypothetical protein
MTSEAYGETDLPEDLAIPKRRTKNDVANEIMAQQLDKTTFYARLKQEMVRRRAYDIDTLAAQMGVTPGKIRRAFKDKTFRASWTADHLAQITLAADYGTKYLLDQLANEAEKPAVRGNIARWFVERADKLQALLLDAASEDDPEAEIAKQIDRLRKLRPVTGILPEPISPPETTERP